MRTNDTQPTGEGREALAPTHTAVVRTGEVATMLFKAGDGTETAISLDYEGFLAFCARNNHLAAQWVADRHTRSN